MKIYLTFERIFLLFIILICSGLHLSAQNISISFSASDYSGYGISCHGASNGFIQPVVTGGAAPYQFLWNNGSTTKDISSLNAGIYILTVTDSLNAIAKDSVILTEPNAISVLLSSAFCHNSPDYHICHPGTAEATIYSTITGGSGGYSYSWSTGEQYATLTNAMAGDFHYF